MRSGENRWLWGFHSLGCWGKIGGQSRSQSVKGKIVEIVRDAQDGRGQHLEVYVEFIRRNISESGL